MGKKPEFISKKKSSSSSSLLFWALGRGAVITNQSPDSLFSHLLYLTTPSFKIQLPINLPKSFSSFYFYFFYFLHFTSNFHFFILFFSIKTTFFLVLILNLLVSIWHWLISHLFCFLAFMYSFLKPHFFLLFLSFLKYKYTVYFSIFSAKS